MAQGAHGGAAESFDPLRPRLIRVAYRMLGSVADAEDVVQEAFIRWMGADRDAVREPEAFLRRTVTRLCLDQLKSARRNRETYIGPWLPDPVVDDAGEEEDVTLPLMLALERLSPLERAAFLLHDVFGVGFEEIAATVERDPAACRQLAARARAHVREARPRYRVERQHGLRLPAPSSPPRGAATWRRWARCWHGMSACTAMAAASALPRSFRCWASARSCRCTRRWPCCSANMGRRWCAWD
ncbi:RNA polymerase sigma-70 factor, ECF subfamily [Sphingobium fuliginis]|uniref:RNA polymerase sigma-70 factor, ECF subfamily n=1 Tax=Sphingobium fuliginis (strain ATCC 27551) TaxID=336203 RepID=A0A292ZGE8_SPHSA|nr:RNA polymerase sigma-70 factor, ECF subfamily [Sphingobium fuliginis]